METTPAHVPDHGDLAGIEDRIGDGTERCADIKRQAKLGGYPIVRRLLERIHDGGGEWCPGCKR